MRRLCRAFEDAHLFIGQDLASTSAGDVTRCSVVARRVSGHLLDPYLRLGIPKQLKHPCVRRRVAGRYSLESFRVIARDRNAPRVGGKMERDGRLHGELRIVYTDAGGSSEKRCENSIEISWKDATNSRRAYWISRGFARESKASRKLPACSVTRYLRISRRLHLPSSVFTNIADTNVIISFCKKKVFYKNINKFLSCYYKIHRQYFDNNL